MQQLVIQEMSFQHGHKDLKYNPNDEDEVRKMREYIRKKIDQGWKLYGMKAGDKDMHIIDVKKLDDPKLDRFILAGHEKVSKKLLASPNAGG
jgi:hypothetical protein